MESTVASYGSRIKYIEDGNLLVSHKIYSNGHKMVRITIDKVAMTYKLIDPVTGVVHVQNTKNYTNLEVVQRNAKKDLKKILNIKFDKEQRDTSNE